jgi:hypothetical protein
MPTPYDGVSNVRYAPGYREAYPLARPSPRHLLRVRPEQLQTPLACTLTYTCSVLTSPSDPASQHGMHTPRESYSHISPSVPGCLPTRSILRISSSVTPSLEKSPPCTTKYRLRPFGDRIAPAFALAGGGFVALTRVASGTVKYLVRVGRIRVCDIVRTSRENILEQLEAGRKLRSQPQLKQMRYLITLLAMLVLRFSLESVGSVHPISNKVPQHLE